MAIVYGTNIETNAVPSLDLRFADRKNLIDTISGRNLINFSRNSVGTYVDENGLIQSATSGEARFDHNPTTGESLGLLVEEARTNSQTYSTHLASSSWSTADATAVPNAALAPDGTFTALRLVENSANAVHNYAINYTEETTSSLTIFAKEGARRYLHIAVSGNSGIFTYSIIIDLRTAVINDPKFFNGTPISSSSATLCANGWVKISVSSNKSRYWKASISTASVHTNFDTDYGQETYAGDGTSDLFLWGIQYEAGSFPTSYIPTPATFTGRASTATYYNSAGVIQTAGSGVARDDAYFPDENGVFRSAGLLLEAAVTNYIDESVDLTDDSTWFNYKFLAPTLNAGTAPDGTNTATSLVPNTETVNRTFACYNIATTFQGTLTVSIFAKANGYNRFVLGIDGSSAGGSFGGGATFDLSTGTVTQGSSGVGAITELPNGWYRCSVTHTNTAQAFLIYPVIAGQDNSGNTFWAGDGTSGYLFWGAQLEESSYPTSYIPTAGSTVTRAADTSTSSTVARVADVASIPASPYLYGTFLARYKHQPPSGLFRQIFSVGAANAYTAFVCRTEPTSLVNIVLPGIIDIRSTANTETSGFNNVATTRVLGDYAVCLNGGTVAKSSITTNQTDNSVITFMYGTIATNSGGTISRFTYYPQRLQDSTLQKLTE